MKLKKRVAAFASAALMLFTLNACTSKPQTQPQATVATTAPQINPETVLNKANKYISESNGKIDGYLAALDELAKLPEDSAKDGAIEKFLLETLEKSLELIGEEKSGFYQPDEVRGHLEYLIPVAKILTNNSNPELEEQKTTLIINLGVEIMNLNDMETAIAFWQENGTETMHVLLEAGKIFGEGKNVAAVTYLRDAMENSTEYEWWTFRMFMDQSKDDLESRLDYLKAYAMIVNADMETKENWLDEVKQAETVENYEESIVDYWKGNIDTKNVKAISDRDIQKMTENCGKEAAGKVLILNRKRPFNSETTVLSVDSHNYNLPATLLPERVEEISYILLFDTDYEDTGEKFNVGTALIKEISQIKVYSVAEGKAIYESDKKETKLNLMVSLVYNGEPPEYYAPNHPDMAEAALEALDLILKQLNN